MVLPISLTHANVISVLGIGSLPEEERKEIVMSAIELVEARTLERVLGSLEEESRRELLSILEREDADELTPFLEAHSIDLVALSEEEIEGVKQELAAIADTSSLKEVE